MATLFEANEAYKAGKHDEAIFLIGQAALEGPRLYSPWLLLGTIYRTEGKVAPAQTAYEKALRILDENGDPLLSTHEQTEEKAHIRAQIDSLQK
jgi:cytochrome c-type biogenesis protein CcmH/NrfG